MEIAVEDSPSQECSSLLLRRTSPRRDHSSSSMRLEGWPTIRTPVDPGDLQLANLAEFSSWHVTIESQSVHVASNPVDHHPFVSTEIDRSKSAAGRVRTEHCVYDFTIDLVR